jgi:hypothetical protein
VVKPIAVALDVTPVTVASLLTAQPVPHDDVAVTMNLTVTACDSVPVDPVTVTVKLPAEAELQDRVAVCGLVPNVTLAGKLQVNPAGVEAETARATVPVRPLTAVTVIVDVAETPVLTAAGDVAAMVKSTTWNVIGPVG